MTSANSAARLPPLLEPHLRLPDESDLIVVTGVLAATTNWLTLRYLVGLLPSAGKKARGVTEDFDGLNIKNNGKDLAAPDAAPETCVILLSFLRDYSFWREGASKLGLDLDVLSRNSRFAFVDGLTQLFSSARPEGSRVPRSPSTSLANDPLRRVLVAPTIAELDTKISAAVADLSTFDSMKPIPRIVLVVDQVDFLLAAGGASVTVEHLSNGLLAIREKIHATILTCSADEPLISLQSTPVEREHAAFVLGQAHQASLLLSLRELDTGAAKDVSGVVRITGGGENDVDEREYLYHVGGDGGVRVFERGGG